MGTKYREVGGGPAVGLSKDFINFLESGLMGGSFGAGAAGQTQGIAGVLNDILAGGGGRIGGSLQDIISRNTETNVNNLRSRFGVGGGTAFGTPAAYAEATYRAQEGPQLINAIGGLQMNALAQLLPIFANLSSKGIAQRETIAQPSPIVSAIQTAAPLASIAAAPFTGGASLAALPAMIQNANTLSTQAGTPTDPTVGLFQGFDPQWFSYPWQN